MCGFPVMLEVLVIQNMWKYVGREVSFYDSGGWTQIAGEGELRYMDVDL
jgi:hypothetical protein